MALGRTQRITNHPGKRTETSKKGRRREKNPGSDSCAVNEMLGPNRSTRNWSTKLYVPDLDRDEPTRTENDEAVKTLGSEIFLDGRIFGTCRTFLPLH